MQSQYKPAESPSILRRIPSIRAKAPENNAFTTPDKAIHDQVNCSRDDTSQTLTNSSDIEQQFEHISTKVNETIKELGTIYSQIGYSENETKQKKAEIFQVIKETVASFKHSLQREKETIENECEWLRQQIRIILAMLDDTSGEKTLRQFQRSIVFHEVPSEGDGERHMMLDFDTSMSTTDTTRCFLLQENTDKFASYKSRAKYESLELSSDSISMPENYKATDQSLQPSLLSCKTKLNAIFLDALKAFVSIFGKFNELNRLLWENLDSVYDESQLPCGSSILALIPDRATAEEHARLIDDFHTIMDNLKLSNNPGSEEAPRGTSEESAFIISSPRKQKMPAVEPSTDIDDLEKDTWMNKLRETNYNIVRIIRSLKITKLTSEVISTLNSEIAQSEKEVQQRTKDMKSIIQVCLNTIMELSLSEKDLISLQRMQEKSDTNGSCDGFFDIETLNFIETNPREFGLSDHHLEFITKLANTLTSLKDAKQRKWDHYHGACQTLWEKLHENPEFVQQFLVSNSNLTDTAITNFKTELKRLYLKRSEFVESFISDSRRQIQQLHSKLLYSEYQSRQFKYYAYDINEDVVEDKEMVLTEHEAEVAKLTHEYQAKQPILSLYSQLNELIEDQKFLVESSKDSSRLLSKNSCKILLNEEKIRKKINRNLPRVLASLKQEIIEYNNQQLSTGERTISVNGEDLFEKVLLIESSSAPAKSRPKPVSKPTSRSSPTKRPPGSRGASPSKTAHSPYKVTKVNGTNSHVGSKSGPAVSKKAFRIDSPTNSPSQMNPSRLPPMSRLSPAKPRDASDGSTIYSTQLKPLQSPLKFSLESKDPRQSDNESAGNTLYSTCLKTSPLRSMGNAFSGNTSGSKFPVNDYMVAGSEEEDKENPPSSQKRQKSEIDSPRLSGGSFANSTFINDDYQSWREERIKQINHEF